MLAGPAFAARPEMKPILESRADGQKRNPDLHASHRIGRSRVWVASVLVTEQDVKLQHDLPELNKETELSNALVELYTWKSSTLTSQRRSLFFC